MNRHQVVKNRDLGSTFEEFFQTQARLRGVYVEKNHLKAKIMGHSGEIKLLTSNLDFTLIYEGRVSFIDCKCFDDDHFTYSNMDPDQVSQSLLHNELGVVSGFCVWFQKTNMIGFYSGRMIQRAGSRSRFEIKDSLVSARFDQFDIRNVLKLY